MATRVINCKVGDKVVIPKYSSTVLGFEDARVDEAMKDKIFTVTYVEPVFVTEDNIELFGFAEINVVADDGCSQISKGDSIIWLNNTQIELAP